MPESAAKQYKVSQFFAIRAITGISVSPDSKTIAFITNTDGMPNIWTIPIEGGWASQVTLQENAVTALKYSPKKNEIIFRSDNQGDENHQLFMIPDKGGDYQYLTPSHIGAQVEGFIWNTKGNKIMFSSNKRERRYFDTYTYDLKSKTEQCIFESNDIYPFVPEAWSKNERYIGFIKFYNNSNQDIFLYDTVSKTMVNVSEHKGQMKNSHAKFDKKNETIYFLSDYEREFEALAYYKIKSGEIGWSVLENWDITGYAFSQSEKYLLYAVNDNGNTTLKLKNFKSGKTKKLKIFKGNCFQFIFTPDEKKIVIIYDSPKNPNDIYVYDIKKEKLKQKTFSMIGGIPKKEFVSPIEVNYKSFDGLEIFAYLYLPKNAKKNGKTPAVLWPHGGPEWQEKNLFNKYFQILVNRGYVVIAPNFRGSTGYGKTFQNKIYKDWGGAEFKDVLGAYDYLVSSGYADRSNIAVVGGSFGGFMTLTCITKAPDLWKCAVDVFGPSNLLTFLDSIPEHWKPGTNDLVGNPVDDKEMLYERSPVNYVDNIKCPLFIIQGKNDPRVKQAESDQIADKLKSQGKEVEYLVLEDEGHGFSRVNNQILVWEKICGFLDSHMKQNN